MATGWRTQIRQIQSATGQRGGPSEPVFGGELRDAERAIRLWKQKAAELGRPPPASVFNMPQPAMDSYRFFICADLLVPEDSVLILYSANFAKLLGLPERPATNVPLLSQIPVRYQPLFVEGYERAITEATPVRFSGAIAHGGDNEVYRASFMPVRADCGGNESASDSQLVEDLRF